MDKIILFFKTGFASCGILVSQLVGGFDQWLKVLVAFMVLDIVTGVIKAVLKKSDKTKQGGLDSTAMWKGGVKKIIIFVVVVIATLADTIIYPQGAMIRTFVIVYYVAGEGLSVLENAAACGVPLPKKLLDVLERLKQNAEEIKTIDKENVYG